MQRNHNPQQIAYSKLPVLKQNQRQITSLHSSTRMKNRSNRDMIGAVIVMFWRNDFDRS